MNAIDVKPRPNGQVLRESFRRIALPGRRRCGEFRQHGASGDRMPRYRCFRPGLDGAIAECQSATSRRNSRNRPCPGCGAFSRVSRTNRQSVARTCHRWSNAHAAPGFNIASRTAPILVGGRSMMARWMGQCDGQHRARHHDQASMTRNASTAWMMRRTAQCVLDMPVAARSTWRGVPKKAGGLSAAPPLIPRGGFSRAGHGIQSSVKSFKMIQGS
jgi:hypothetical protein